MPMVKNKKFPYTKTGKEDAVMYAKKVGGKVKAKKAKKSNAY